MRVLFVSHTAQRSGAEVVMLRLIEGVRERVECAVACPPEGALADAVHAAGLPLVPIAGTAVNLRLSPRRTAKGLAALACSTLDLARGERGLRPDVVHANTLRAGLIAAPPRLAGGPPLVVQTHEHLPPGALSRAVREVVARSADRVIAVTDWTARSFDAGLARPVARRIYPSVDHDRFRPRAADRRTVLSRIGVAGDGPLLGQVAQITPWKAQDVTVKAFARVLERFPDAHLLLIGSISFDPGTRYDNAAFLRSLEQLIDDLGVRDRVHLLGQRDDVPELLSVLDLHLLPSWDEPFGTAAAEAMAAGTVPLVSSVGGVPEYVEDGVSGRVLPPREPAAWAKAAIELLADPERRARMAARAVEVAGRFTIETYARQVEDAWREAVAAARGGRSKHADRR